LICWLCRKYLDLRLLSIRMPFMQELSLMKRGMVREL